MLFRLYRTEDYDYWYFSKGLKPKIKDIEILNKEEPVDASLRYPKRCIKIYSKDYKKIKKVLKKSELKKRYKKVIKNFYNLTLNQGQSGEILLWNLERKLIQDITKPEDIINNYSYILEEIIEGLTGLKSKEARPLALGLCNYFSYNQDFSKLEKFLQEQKQKELNILPITDIINSLDDMKVFIDGFIWKFGYNPKNTLNEVIKEISFRKGKIINGKFVKDPNIKTYQVNYKKEKKLG